MLDASFDDNHPCPECAEEHGPFFDCQADGGSRYDYESDPFYNSFGARRDSATGRPIP